MTLEELAKACEELSTVALFGGKKMEDPADNTIEESEGTLDPMAEQELLAAIHYLRLATCAAMKAHYWQVRGRAASQAAWRR